jgi:hypothetical protein
MHTLKAIFGGFLLLGVCLLLGRWIGGAAATVVAPLLRAWIHFPRAPEQFEWDAWEVGDTTQFLVDQGEQGVEFVAVTPRHTRNNWVTSLGGLCSTGVLW